jgi:phenylacetic acid degradation operon negative regulatory protein
MYHIAEMTATARLLDTIRPTSTSLIVTVFGDSILPHGGTVWLGSLIHIMTLFGLNDRGVRTAVFRLAKEGWLAPTQVGRRSYYALTESARLRFQAAHRAIYAAAPRPWDGTWTAVLTGLLAASTRDRLRDELRWQGFGEVLPGLLVHPAPDEPALRQTLLDAGAAVPVMAASGKDWAIGQGAGQIVQRAWNLDELAGKYDTFLTNFRPFLFQAEGAAPAVCLTLRTLLIHEYRRILLRDPLLPDELLPPHWPGSAARLLCRNLYRLLQDGSERFLVANLETAEGAPPDADARYYERFGGLTGG